MKITLALTLLLVNTLNVFSQWTDAGLNGGPYYQAPVYFKKSFYIRGYEGIYKSADKGTTWTKVYTHTSSRPNYNDDLLSTTENLIVTNTSDSAITISSDGINWHTIKYPDYFYKTYLTRSRIYGIKYRNEGDLVYVYENGEWEAKYSVPSSECMSIAADDTFYIYCHPQLTSIPDSGSANIKNTINGPVSGVLAGKGGSYLFTERENTLGISRLNLKNGIWDRISTGQGNPSEINISGNYIIWYRNDTIHFSGNSGDTWKEIDKPEEIRQLKNLNLTESEILGVSATGFVYYDFNLQQWVLPSNKNLPWAFSGTSLTKDNEIIVWDSYYENKIIIQNKSGQLVLENRDKTTFRKNAARFTNGKYYSAYATDSIMVSEEGVNWKRLELTTNLRNDGDISLKSYGNNKMFYCGKTDILFNASPVALVIVDENGNVGWHTKWGSHTNFRDVTGVNNYVFMDDYLYSLKGVDTLEFIKQSDKKPEKILRVGERIYMLSEDSYLYEYDFTVFDWKLILFEKLKNIFTANDLLFTFGGNSDETTISFLGESDHFQGISEGLPEKYIVASIEYSDGKYYLATDKGIYISRELILNTKSYKADIAKAIIYPNPATDKVFIFTENADITNLEIFSPSGNKIDTETKISGSNAEINLRNLKGIYLLQTETTKGKTIEKIVVY